ncbi:unnamed protein product [Clavelina lepadiformis]|uniref:Glutathione peroxidase n=1 Tax=Clavelina lepadiformis TaxID=159417 RepID=A0ABP0EZX3_CLALP
MASLPGLIWALIVAMTLCDFAKAQRRISSRVACNPTRSTIYDQRHYFTKLSDRSRVSLSRYRGSTWQYPLLNALHDLDGVTVLGFPCNQFGLQEPGHNSEILPILEHVRPGRGYVPNFPLFEKLEVNGDSAHPLFKYMKGQCEVITSAFPSRSRLFYDPITPFDIEWNFHKFLVDHEGKVVRRYHHNVSPTSYTIRKDIRDLLRRRATARNL